jgi:hypothetical protein
MLPALRQQSIRLIRLRLRISVCGRPYYAAAILYRDIPESKHGARGLAGAGLTGN